MDFESGPWLHIYPQHSWHDEAQVVGTREALRKLRDACDAALADDNGVSVSAAFASDGEGYCVQVYCVSLTELQHMAMPYADKIARGKGGMYPYQLPRQPTAEMKRAAWAWTKAEKAP